MGVCLGDWQDTIDPSKVNNTTEGINEGGGGDWPGRLATSGIKTTIGE